jgi:hypothetical protein
MQRFGFFQGRLLVASAGSEKSVGHPGKLEAGRLKILL